MVDYIKFVLNQHFQNLLGDGKSLEFRQVFFIVFKPEIWEFMIKFAPEVSVRVITCVLMNNNCIREINNYDSR